VVLSTAPVLLAYSALHLLLHLAVLLAVGKLVYLYLAKDEGYRPYRFLAPTPPISLPPSLPPSLPLSHSLSLPSC
jgi:hypothetical protein